MDQRKKYSLTREKSLHLNPTHLGITCKTQLSEQSLYCPHEKLYIN